jgi:hypothetical protein
MRAAVMRAAVMRAAVMRAAVMRAAVMRAAVMRAAVMRAAVTRAAVMRAAVMRAAVKSHSFLPAPFQSPVRSAVIKQHISELLACIGKMHTNCGGENRKRYRETLCQDGRIIARGS